MDRLVRLEAALKHCNDVITAEGGTPRTRLSKGQIRAPGSCPITNTVKDGVGSHSQVTTGTSFTWVNPQGDNRKYKLSDAARTFVTDFDFGLYPELQS